MTIPSQATLPGSHLTPRGGLGDQRLGAALVFGSALVWSFGGAIERFLAVEDIWTTVFWRSAWAAAFLLTFMLLRDGRRGTVALFRNMGAPGLAVAACFAIASTSFVVALSHTTVANILLMQAGVPLIAALIGWTMFGERVMRATWVAIAAVVAGVGIMVSDSLTGAASPVGDALALLIAFVFALATVVTRRHADVRMTPACCLGTMVAAAVSGVLAAGFAVTVYDMALLFAFGALTLGLGMALFVTGARLLPSPVSALIGMAEPVLGPLWVWLVLAEAPSPNTVIGGLVVLAALLGHLGWQLRRHRPRSP